MRVILTPPTPPDTVPTLPVPILPRPGEPTGATWCRDIATAVADGLGTRYQHGYHQHVRRPVRSHGPARRQLCPEALFGFTVAAHRVDIAVVWDQAHREPGFALTVDTAPVAFRAPGRPRTAPVLAHAALRAITTEAIAPDRAARHGAARHQATPHRQAPGLQTPPVSSIAAAGRGSGVG